MGDGQTQIYLSNSHFRRLAFLETKGGGGFNFGLLNGVTFISERTFAWVEWDTSAGMCKRDKIILRRMD